MNPYNFSLPGNLFRGYRGCRREMVSSLTNGSLSYVIYGGRSCGKSSLFLKLADDLTAANKPGLRIRKFSMKTGAPRDPADFYRTMYDAIVDGAGEAEPAGSIRDHFSFRKHLDGAYPLLESTRSLDWITVLMMDDVDRTPSTLLSGGVFEQIRDVFNNSAYHNHLRLVVTGSSGIRRLTELGSPLNFLSSTYLGVLEELEARELVHDGFPEGLSCHDELMRLTGRHPFLLQGLLVHLWDDPHRNLSEAVNRFTRDRNSTLSHWLRDIGEDGVKVYRALAASRSAIPDHSLHVRGVSVDDVVGRLSYHGLVDHAATGSTKVTSELFRQWFLRNTDTQPAATERQKVLVVHGRNRKIRNGIFQLLEEVGLEPLEWHEMVGKTGRGAPGMLEILSAGFKAANFILVLFTPDDEASLRPEHVSEGDADYEKTPMPQPRPNVLFEAGMAMALNPEHTVLVRFGAIRGLSDLSGLHFFELDDSVATRRRLLEHLKILGCELDLDSTGWRKVQLGISETLGNG